MKYLVVEGQYQTSCEIFGGFLVKFIETGFGCTFAIAVFLTRRCQHNSTLQ
jgi:hypothetical protein